MMYYLQVILQLFGELSASFLATLGLSLTVHPANQPHASLFFSASLGLGQFLQLGRYPYLRVIWPELVEEASLVLEAGHESLLVVDSWIQS